MHKSNHCFLIGNLGADPVERGRNEKTGPIVKFNIAENVQVFDKETRKYKTVHTNWFTITSFGTLADRALKGLKKGDRVAIQGRIQTSKYTDKNGDERTGFEIVADDIGTWALLPSSAISESREPEALPF